jgi:hypothetical protein
MHTCQRHLLFNLVLDFYDQQNKKIDFDQEKSLLQKWESYDKNV